MWVKICGIRTVEGARQAVEAGADALGFNFYAASLRHVEPTTAAALVRDLPDAVEAVGLFVNHPLDEVRRIATLCGLKTLQLHGDESPGYLRELSDFSLLRAFRVGAEGLGEVADYLAACQAIGVKLKACLVDAKVAGAYGGTGRLAPWELLRTTWNTADWPPLVLAGGLAPDNVAEAVTTVRPWGVDVAGGVESSLGVKDPSRMVRFVAEARRADN